MELGNHSPQEDRGKRIKQVCLVSIISILIALFPIGISGKWFGVALLIATMIILVFAYFQADRNHVDRAAIIIILTISGLMLAFSWLNEGLRDEALLIFPTMVTYSVLVGSSRVANGLIVAVLINITAMGLAVDFDLMTFVTPDDGIERAIPILIIFAATGYSLKLLGNDLIKANRALKQSKEELEDRVEERTRELSDSLSELQHAQSELIESEKMASLGKLVAGVAHEINTPIGIAVTASSHLSDAHAQINKKWQDNKLKKSDFDNFLRESQESTDLINANLARAAQLVWDFKNVSVIQTDERRVHVQFDDQLNHIVASLKSELEAKNVTVNRHNTVERSVYIDAVAFAQILTNLITNSLIHGFENRSSGTIDLTITESDNNFILDYRDDGNGIPDETVEQIFDPFVTSKRGQGGTGLGMHIVYNLITHSFGGNIEVDKNSKSGAHFTLSWPVYKSHSQ